MAEFSRIVRFLVLGIIISLFQTIIIFSQSVIFYSKIGISNPVVVIQCDDEIFAATKDTIESNSTKIIPSLILINSSKLKNFAIRDTVNFFLNTHNLNVSKVFLIVIGGEQLLIRQTDFYDHIYGHKCYVSTDGSEMNVRGYFAIPIEELNLPALINQFLNQGLWEIDVDEIKGMTIKEYRRKKTGIELGLGFTKIFPTGIHNSDDIPKQMSVFQIQINKQLGENYKIMGNIGMSLKMPSKNNMNMETSFSGDDYELIGSSIFAWSVDIAKFIKPKEALHPFVAVGITKSNLMLMYGRKNGSSMSVKPEMYAYGSLSLTAGAELRFNERINLDVKASYHFSLNTGTRIDNFNVSAGLNINLHKKIKYYYNYLRLK
jgi:hypothetical protein